MQVVVESPARARTLQGYLGAGHEAIINRSHAQDLAAMDRVARPRRGAPEGLTYNGYSTAESVGSVRDPTLRFQSETEGNSGYPPTTTVGHPSPVDQTLEKLRRRRAR